MLALLVALPAAMPARAADCDGLARRLRLGVLDGMWGGVLEDAEKILAECGGPQAETAAYYQARALDRLRRHDQALPAYRAFLDRHCRGDESFLCEDATVQLYTLAKGMVEKGDEGKVQILLDGLKAGDFYSKVFAGIQISSLPANKAAKQKALPVLVEAYRLEDDADFRNEICLAIIRIDPSKCGGGPGRTKPEFPEPQWIKVRVWDCAAEVEKVKVNLPFSFAQAAIESLGPEVMTHIRAEGFDIENMWESLKKLKPNEKFTLSIKDGGECQDIEIWFE